MTYFIPPNAQAHFLHHNGAYSHIAPGGSSVIPVLVTIGANAPPPNRQLAGRLLVGQRLDTTATSGWAAQYTITGNTGSGGNLETVSLSAPVGEVGIGGFGIRPTITVQVSALGFDITFANPNIGSGNVTGLFDLQIGWVA